MASKVAPKGRRYNKKDIRANTAGGASGPQRELVARIEEFRTNIAQREKEDIRNYIIKNTIPMQYQKTMAQFKAEEAAILKQYPGQRRHVDHAVNAMRQQMIIQGAQASDPRLYDAEVERRARAALAADQKKRKAKRSDIIKSNAEAREAARKAETARKQVFNQLKQQATPRAVSVSERKLKASNTPIPTTSMARKVPSKSTGRELAFRRQSETLKSTVSNRDKPNIRDRTSNRTNDVKGAGTLPQDIVERKRRAREKLSKGKDDSRSFLNQAEGQAASDIQSDPTQRNLAERSQQYLDSLTEQDLAEIDAEALDEIDDFFNRKEQETRDQLSMKLRHLNEQFGLFNEKELFELGVKLDQLQADTALELSESINDMQRRGAIDSGLLTRAADIIVEASERDEGIITKESEFSVRERMMGRDQKSEELRKAADIDILELGHAKETEARIVKQQKLQELGARNQLDVQAEGDEASIDPEEEAAKSEVERVDTTPPPPSEKQSNITKNISRVDNEATRAAMARREARARNRPSSRTSGSSTSSQRTNQRSSSSSRIRTQPVKQASTRAPLTSSARRIMTQTLNPRSSAAAAMRARSAARGRSRR